jgi:hypothetical protein
MFPLKERKIIRGAAAHVKAGLGVATDYEAVYVIDSVPFDGVLKNYWGTEGGNWCRLTRPNGDKIEMAHHSKYLLKSGPVKEGQAMAVTGNTGAITTRPHLHIQIIDKYGKRLDPEKYNWNSSLKKEPMFREYKGTIYGLLAGYWVAVATSYQDFLTDWGGVEAKPMTDAQFKAFPLNKRTIK